MQLTIERFSYAVFLSPFCAFYRHGQHIIIR